MLVFYNLYLHIFNFAWIFYWYDSRYHSNLLSGNRQITIFFLPSCFFPIHQCKQEYKQEVAGMLGDSHSLPNLPVRRVGRKSPKSKKPSKSNAPQNERGALSAFEGKTLKTQQSLLLMNLACIFLPTPTLPAPRSKQWDAHQQRCFKPCFA